jgi:hypothetical protein
MVERGAIPLRDEEVPGLAEALGVEATELRALVTQQPRDSGQADQPDAPVSAPQGVVTEVRTTSETLSRDFPDGP